MNECCICKKPMGRGTKPCWVVDRATLAPMGQAHATHRYSGVPWHGPLYIGYANQTLEDTQRRAFAYRSYRPKPESHSPAWYAVFLLLNSSAEDHLTWWQERHTDPLSPEKIIEIRQEWARLEAEFRALIGALIGALNSKEDMEALRMANTLLLYRQWSEETWAAGFIYPSKSMVLQFREWLKEVQEEMDDYEAEMLVECAKQEAEAKAALSQGQEGEHGR